MLTTERLARLVYDFELVLMKDFSTSRTMASISGMLPSDVNVLRDGRQITIPARDLVVGDLVFVSLGNKVSPLIQVY